MPYITAGHPDEARTIDLIAGLESAGADAIELGLPFSDPMADGPVIQASSQQALEQGMNFDRLLELVSRSRASLCIAGRLPWSDHDRRHEHCRPVQHVAFKLVIVHDRGVRKAALVSAVARYHTGIADRADLAGRDCIHPALRVRGNRKVFDCDREARSTRPCHAQRCELRIGGPFGKVTKVLGGEVNRVLLQLRGHQLINRTDAVARYIEISNRDAADCAEYPDVDMRYIAADDGFTRKDGTRY